MPLQSRVIPLALPYRHGGFHIANAPSDVAETVLLVLQDQETGRTGFGEAVPSMRVTGTSRAEVLSTLAGLEPVLHGLSVDAGAPPPRSAALLHERFPDAPKADPHDGSGPIACALDGALLDLWAQARDLPLWQALGLPEPTGETSGTVSLASPEAMADEARRLHAAGFDILKLKLGEGAQADSARVHAVAEAAPEARLRIDANESWDPDRAITMLPVLAQAGVDLIEQPLPRATDANTLRRFTTACERLDVLHVLDESVHTVRDVTQTGERQLAHGVNVKLQKAGGLRPALELFDTAAEYGLHRMVGCFVETWAGIALALHGLGRVDHIDLDGAWLLAEQPVESAGGPLLDRGRLRPADAAGLGVRAGLSFPFS